MIDNTVFINLSKESQIEILMPFKNKSYTGNPFMEMDEDSLETLKEIQEKYECCMDRS